MSVVALLQAVFIAGEACFLWQLCHERGYKKYVARRSTLNVGALLFCTLFPCLAQGVRSELHLELLCCQRVPSRVAIDKMNVVSFRCVLQ
jgi:hypothetical protein